MRPRRPGFSDPEIVFSNKHATNGFFHALVPTMECSTVTSVRVAVDTTAVGLVSIRIGYQLSDDGVTWPASTTAPTLLTAPSAITTEGLTFPTTFEDITAGLTKRFLRIGAWVVNASGTAVELAVVAIRVETRNN